eukprot:TRINITY_DN45490_c0_g1_i1.p1 TRINITY_DN45490_c0_g1~~TRINITY_DN45490_c0_g1_i1.p1  ORF type:complete len:258 (+),score=35.45 TRINITY_DN45490_c0_g1_i1:289-1062(+)
MNKDMQAHRTRHCPERQQHCECCAQEYTACIMSEHLHVCPDREEPCPLGCEQAKLTPRRLDEHLAHQCALRTVRCSLGCGCELQAQREQQHQARECSLRGVTCSLDCDTAGLTAGVLEVHMKECPRRSVKCTLGCGELLEYQHVETHSNQCPTLVMVCEPCRENGVEEDETHMTRAALRSHQRRCLYSRVPCPQACGKTLERRHVLGHVADTCPLRSVSCPFAPECQVKCVPYRDLREHVKAHYSPTRRGFMLQRLK